MRHKYFYLVSGIFAAVCTAWISVTPYALADAGATCSTLTNSIGCFTEDQCIASGGKDTSNLGNQDCPEGTICCGKKPSAPAPAAQAGQQDVSKPSGSGGLSLALPPCIKTGNCTVDDIVGTGAAFANFITILSAALFFATFVYGGAMYVLSFGDKSRVDKGKKALTGAAIGMALVLSAWTLVNYVAGSLLGKK